MTLGLVITCHAGYLRFLGECLAAWDAQARHLHERVLVLDGVTEAQCPDPAGWTVVRGGWANPNPARNAGLLQCHCEWVIHWDADNLPPADYATQARQAMLSAPRVSGIGALVPSVRREGEARILNRSLCGGDSRDGFLADTGSVWRRDAILHAGGWCESSTGLDDWRLAKDLEARGWRLAPLAGVTVVQRDHPERRSYAKDTTACVWQHRRLGIVTLLAGRLSIMDRWLATLRTLELPARWGLTLMLPQARPGLRSALLDRLEQGCDVMASPPRRVTLLVADQTALTARHDRATGDAFLIKHRAVGALYAQALAATPEDTVLTWEDDVFPHRADAVRRLSDAMTVGSRLAAVAAVYPSRERPDHACAAAHDGWRGVPKLDAPQPRVHDMACVAYGFTLWHRAALEEAPMLCGEREAEQRVLGLDGEQCRRLRAAGWRLQLHGGVTCDHVTDLGGTN